MAWLLLLCAAGCADGRHGAGRAASDRTLAVVIKGVENPFFATMRDGVMNAVGANKARLAFSAAGGLYDTAGQASALESLGAGRAGCYVVNPINREYEGNVLPENGDPQVVWPKNTVATAAGVAALAQCASSPRFKQASGTS